MPERVHFPDHIRLTTSAALDILAVLETITHQLATTGDLHAAFELDQAAEILRVELFQTE
ncbi:MAG: hypothetical protein OSA99_18830 [Acidimicrobiales bacterium]|nr:hypothetical protein [Acidimicrobiales bacterium]